jgi:hypothetical protein
MLTRRSSGFTIIEATIAMAIAASLASVLFAGRGQLRVRAQFSDAIEATKNTLAKVKSEAVSTVSQGAGNSATGQIFFAKRVRFTNGSDTLRVDTLLYDPASNAIVVTPVDAREIKLPWGVRFLSLGSTSREVLFVRWPTNGNLYTYSPPLTGFNDGDFSSYDPLPTSTGRAAQIYQFADLETPPHTATIEVNGAAGTINRVFND